MFPAYLQVSAFAAASGQGGTARAAYSVYDAGRLAREAERKWGGVTPRRALLLAVWSAARFCAETMPLHEFCLYLPDEGLARELGEAIRRGAAADGAADGDKVRDIVAECRRCWSAAFGVCTGQETGMMAEYARRMSELKGKLL